MTLKEELDSLDAQIRVEEATVQANMPINVTARTQERIISLKLQKTALLAMPQSEVPNDIRQQIEAIDTTILETEVAVQQATDQMIASPSTAQLYSRLTSLKLQKTNLLHQFPIDVNKLRKI